MAERYRRSQILLEPEQHATLFLLARKRGRSISDVTREIVDLGLKSLMEQKQSRLKALEALGQLQARIERRHGLYEGEGLLADIRAERQAELEIHLKRSKP